MMRAARRASLLVTFYVLTSAATAYAECAWVLWAENESTVKKESGTGTLTLPRTWKVVQAELSKAACVSALGGHLALIEELAKLKSAETAEVLASPGGASVTWKYPESDPFVVKQQVVYYCLPDTVDPRGPKGK